MAFKLGGIFKNIGQNLGLGGTGFQAYQPTLLNNPTPTGPSEAYNQTAKLFDMQQSGAYDKALQSLGGMGASAADTMSLFGSDAGSVARLGGQMGRAGQNIGQELGQATMQAKQGALADDISSQWDRYYDNQLRNWQTQNQANMQNFQGAREADAARKMARGGLFSAVGGAFGGPLGGIAGRLLA